MKNNEIMKEISIEEKAARYDEAINRIKHYVVDKYGCSRIKVADIFPELKDSDDERIRKELIAEFKEQIDCIPAPDCRDKEDEKSLKQLNKWLAWLEKQGEQWKPNDEMLEALYRAIPENVMEISEDAILLDKLYQGLKYGRVLSKK